MMTIMILFKIVITMTLINALHQKMKTQNCVLKNLILEIHSLTFDNVTLVSLSFSLPHLSHSLSISLSLSLSLSLPSLSLSLLSNFHLPLRLCSRRSSGEKHCCSYRAWNDSHSNHPCRYKSLIVHCLISFELTCDLRFLLLPMT